MTTPPRLAERVLTGLGAVERFREPLLGDLAEEFNRRADRDGVASARRWYHKEAARAVPHLLGAWLHELNARELRRQAGILLAAWFFTGVCAFLLIGVVTGVLAAVGVAVDTAAVRAGNPVAFSLLALFVAGIGALTGGWFAASLDERAPLASALMLGVVWSGISVAGQLIAVLAGKYAGPAWYRVAVVLVALIVPALGGVLRTRSTTSASFARVS